MSEPMNAARAEAPATEEPSTLPSEQEGANANPWDASELLDENGMIGGKYKDINGLVKSAKDAEEYISKLNAEKQQSASQVEKAEAEAAATAAKTQTSQELIRKVLDDGLTISEETLAAATEAGISSAELELAAIKSKQHIDKMTSLVGGEEVYNQMITDMGSEMSDAEKAQFTKDVQGSMSSYAVKGIYQAWLEKTGQQAEQSAPRISGSNAPGTGGGVKPYTDQIEMRQDLNYLQTRGRNDKAAWAKHEARKRVTPDSVFYGR